MFVTVLWRMDGSPAAGGNNAFADVQNEAYYVEAVQWAAQNGIVMGIGGAQFSPDAEVTREQMATFLYRYEQYSGKIPPETAASQTFTDGGMISEYALNAVNTLVAQGIINGKPGNLFDPQGQATRAEVAALLQRFLEAL